ncbi:MAG: FG-GAP-like repeat-containing protein [Bryobacterales bacterium]|nr:FG-GAP-like repeat-containing protein [Bryobacterales bacterium]
MRIPIAILFPIALAPALLAQPAAVVPPEYPAASNPDFLVNKPSDDRLAARYPWTPRPLYFGGPDTVGPLDVDWVWPDLALVDWDRDGLLDVVCNLSAGTYSHRPKEQQFRTLIYRNTGQRREGVPIFGEPKQVDLGFPVGSMAFGDADGDGAMDLIVWGRNLFRWYRDASKSGERRFEFVANLQDFGLHADLKLLETVSMSPSLQLVDWDGDGKLDLVAGGRGGNALYYPRREMEAGRSAFAADGAWIGGDRNGSVVYHKNLGLRDGKLCFSTGQRLSAGEDERSITYYDTATAAVTDFDQDGRPDVLVASLDNLFWFRNGGSARAPKLDAGRRVPVAGLARLPWERLLPIEANWSTTDRQNLILQGSSFPWYLPNTGRKGAPKYDRITTLLQKHPPVGAGDFAIPAVGDLNGDGKPDLVIGNEDGYLLYVQNSSASKEPDSFLPAVELKAGGAVFRVESGRGLQGPAEARWGYTIPVLADWDGDGDLDLIVGSLHSYYLLLENRGSRTSPAFAAPVILNSGGKPLGVAWRTRPVVRDFDGDGRQDLMALDPEGMLAVFRRTGPAELAAADHVRDPQGALIKLDGKGRETGRAMLALMDWDEDGRLDLIAGNAVENFDGLRWYKNSGSGAKWVLTRQPNIALNLPWNHYHQFEPVDWNGDGKTDLVAGSEGGWVYYYRHK